MTEYQNWGSEPRPEVARDSWNVEFDQVRATVQALQGAATLLQGAMEQRQGLWSEMRSAEQKLRDVEQQRGQTEQALFNASMQLQRTTRDLEQVRGEQSGVLGEFDRLVQGALARRSALLVEISDLERQRDDLAASVPAPAPIIERASAPTLVYFEAKDVVEPNLPPMEEPSSVVPEAVIEPEPIVDDDDVDPPTPIREPLALPDPAPRRRLHLGWRAATTSLLGALLIGLAVLLTPVTQLAGGLQLLAVMSGSMEPTIQVGGIVGVLPTPASSLQVGDVITFANQSQPDVLVTHRIVSIDERGGQELLTTRGDANDSADAVAVPATRAVGRVEFTAPWLGYAMVWLASPLAKAAILGISVLGLVLPSLKRPSSKPAEVETQTAAIARLERELEALLPRAS
jgi:signal peptidase I